MGFIFPYKSKVLSVTVINHDVLTLKITRPWKFEFTVGQMIPFKYLRLGILINTTVVGLSLRQERALLHFCQFLVIWKKKVSM